MLVLLNNLSTNVEYLLSLMKSKKISAAMCEMWRMLARSGRSFGSAPPKYTRDSPALFHNATFANSFCITSYCRYRSIHFPVSRFLNRALVQLICSYLIYIVHLRYLKTCLYLKTYLYVLIFYSNRIQRCEYIIFPLNRDAFTKKKRLLVGTNFSFLE